jgi:hypothetical protein
MAILAENEAIANKNLLALSNSRSNQRELFSFGIAVKILRQANVLLRFNYFFKLSSKQG